MNDEYQKYFSGAELYGNDFTIDEIEEWFVDESEGYANLGAKDKENYQYPYHEMNKFHAFNLLEKNQKFNNVLGLGSAYGDEFYPIMSRISKLTILDPSDSFVDLKQIKGIPTSYLKPHASGNLAFENNSFDLITTLGVLHHIPNVNHVIKECYRCLSPGGVLLVREPIISMGDWRKRRRGLTMRERGIPIQLMDQFILNAGFNIVSRNFCQFPALQKIANKVGFSIYNDEIMTKIDSLLCKAFSWNLKYHRQSFFQKLGPSSVFYVLSK